jgi:3-oxoacyl-[acyl-carrier-protein] synthase II
VNRRVVVTGVGAVTPLGVGVPALVDGWSAGESGIQDGRGECSAFDPASVLSRKEIHRTDRFAQLALAASEEAIDNAGWSPVIPYPPDRVACVIGTGVGGIGTIERQHTALIQRGPAAVSPLSIPLLMPNAGAAVVSIRYGLMGASLGVASACAAGAHAIGTALRSIQVGDADAAVAGGAEAALTTLTISGFGAMAALSRSGVPRPFDARRDGFVLGEGAGVLVLEGAEVARARGAPVIGELLGYGASGDGHHLTVPQGDGKGAARAIARALDDAGLAAEDVDYVNAHGTATQLNDRAETAALKLALGEHARRVPVSSTKSAIGHLLGASGAVEAVATLLALRRRVAPPTLNYGEPEEGLDLDYVPCNQRPLELSGEDQADERPAVGLSNSFGFGGHNAVLCLAA